MIENKLKRIILEQAKKYEPYEMCGFVVFDGQQNQFILCENIAGDKENFFEISPEDFIKAEQLGEIIALVHSHPNGEPYLSSADRQMQINTQIDWWLVCDGDIYQFEKIPHLLGRNFLHGSSDCYSIFRDFYRLAGVVFPDFERNDLWWLKGKNLYLENMEKQGFERITKNELQIGDVILIQVGADVPNHAAIYLGDQMVLHHSPQRLSKRDLYDGYWLKHTHSIWRYREWLQLDFMVPLSDLEQSLT